MIEQKKNYLFDAGLAFVIAFLMSQVCVLFGTIVLSLFATGTNTIKMLSDSTLGIAWLNLCNQSAFFLTFLYFYKAKKTTYSTTIFARPSFKLTILFVVLGIASMYLLNSATGLVEMLLKSIGYTASSSIPIEMNNFGSYLLAVFVVALLPAVCEELLFRGIITRNIATKSTTAALWLSSLMFAIFHLSAYQFIYPLCFGLLLGLIMLKTHNVFYCILVHFFNNFLVLTLNYISTSSSPIVVSLANAIITSIVGVIIFSLLIFALSRAAFKRPEQVYDKSQKYLPLNLFIALMSAIWCIIFISKF